MFDPQGAERDLGLHLRLLTALLKRMAMEGAMNVPDGPMLDVAVDMVHEIWTTEWIVTNAV